jgi:hypothetical protein
MLARCLLDSLASWLEIASQEAIRLVSSNEVALLLDALLVACDDHWVQVSNWILTCKKNQRMQRYKLDLT